MTELEAINIIARHAIADAAWTVGDAWENYPEIGESDWKMVVHTADRMRVYPTDEEYHEAYALLSARARRSLPNSSRTSRARNTALRSTT